MNFSDKIGRDFKIEVCPEIFNEKGRGVCNLTLLIDWEMTFVAPLIPIVPPLRFFMDKINLSIMDWYDVSNCCPPMSAAEGCLQAAEQLKKVHPRRVIEEPEQV